MFAELPAHASELKQRLARFMDEHVYPNERALLAPPPESSRWAPRPLALDLMREAKAQGLWNLFYNHGPEGQGLTNYEYSQLCEVLGRSLAAPELFNCNAPDVGNMEILAIYGTEQQKQHWLKPLLEGEIRSCFAMTEPRVASSDATNIETRIERDGSDYIINGRKWWVTGAPSERCKVAIVMGKNDPTAPRHKQQSMILVPMNAPGVRVERALSVYGYEHAPLGHAEVVFDNVRVPAENMLLGEGRGFEIAQGRLGPGRIHHCMRFVGLAERALEIMCARAKNRFAFGSTLSDMGGVRQAIGLSRCEIEQARLVTLKAAWAMDRLGNKEARNEIAVAKIVVPTLTGAVIDRAIQVHGGAGLSQDFFLAEAFAETRFLRIGDGPDEVHREALARFELSRTA
ncbi:acyl-CoA dehydrogenase family protein [Tianweitania sediminis]|uniref:Acyl-CoA dehydrogenase family protein n=1 Tax=Tianweitania sediminis TaxID=1502156 RepID=A0A8J7R286_9HYPH|nr:acyl-CoA dehydrogenase family protein [Tianweitania sediminis]MBP0440207.1 acyl-CoA dehydrogenase family protein [Tianweitania sediminis]